MEKNYHAYNDQKKTGVVSLILKQVDKLSYILGHRPRLYNFKDGICSEYVHPSQVIKWGQKEKENSYQTVNCFKIK